MMQVRRSRRLSTLLALVTMMTVLVIPASPVSAATLTVDCDTDGPNALQNAIDVSLAGDVIELSGTCTENISIDGTHTLLTINGNPTATIDGGGLDTVVSITAGRVVNFSDLTITNGVATGIDGGGIRSGGTLNLTNVTVIGNTTNQAGGGIFNGNILNIDGGFVISNTAFDGGGIYNNDSGTAFIDGAAEIGGSATGNGASRFGGGIYNAGTLTVQNDSHLFDNSAGDSGGGVFNTGGVVTLAFAAVNGNSAIVGGGGVYSVGGFDGSTLDIAGSSITFNNAGAAGGVLNADPNSTATIGGSFINNNSATNLIGTGGGGIENATGATMTIDSTDINNNSSANNGGGAIHNSDSVLTISTSNLIGNTATGTSAFGGAIRTSGSLTVDTGTWIQGNTATTGGGVYVAGLGSTFDLDASRMDGNTASGGGGGIHIDPGNTVNLTGASVVNNTATTDGGGVSNVGGTLTLENSTISGNAGANGGGISNSALASVVTSSYSTITDNTALGAGGGFTNSGSVTLEGTILYGNTSGPTLGTDCSGPLTTAGYNLVGVPVLPCVYTPDATDLPALSDPLLSTLTAGQPGYHTLGVGSAAIDAGGPCILAEDQAGNARPDGPACDIGSIEGASPAGPVVDEVLLVQPSGKWHIRQPGNPDYTFFYGNPGDVPLFGDWDNDGVDTPGMYRPSTGFVYLTNTLPADNGSGSGEIFFFYGNPGDQVFVGDWDGINGDSLGIRRGGKIFLRNTNTTGPADLEFFFGDFGDIAAGGDPDNDGLDSVYLQRPSNGFTYYTNDTSMGVAPTDGSFTFGNPVDKFVAGDWDGLLGDSPGVYRGSDNTVLLRNTNDTGVADITDVWPGAKPNWNPVAGVHGVS